MNTKQATDENAVLGYLAKHPKSDAGVIGKHTGITTLQVWNLGRRLQKERKVVISDKLFSLQATAVKAVSVVKKTTKVKTKAKDSRNFGRDFAPWKLDGVEMRKGKLALAGIMKFVKETKPTLAKLRERFPAELVANFGVFAELSDAKKANARKQRFFDKPEQVIKLKDKSLAVTNQISSKNFGGFVAIFKELGYKVTR